MSRSSPIKKNTHPEHSAPDQTLLLKNGNFPANKQEINLTAIIRLSIMKEQ